MSYKVDGKKHHGKMHYCGRTLEEAVEKMRRGVAWREVQDAGTCTSMWIMRGREKGKNIKWANYHKDKQDLIEIHKDEAREYLRGMGRDV